LNEILAIKEVSRGAWATDFHKTVWAAAKSAAAWDVKTCSFNVKKKKGAGFTGPRTAQLWFGARRELESHYWSKTPIASDKLHHAHCSDGV